MNSTLAVLSVGHGHEVHEPGSGAGVFLTTHWSVVMAAKTPTSPEALVALEKLCRTYWNPLYVFVRRQGRGLEDAEDLAQEFFGRLPQKEFLRAVEPERGRFRTFLVMALKRIMANEWDRTMRRSAGAPKRVCPSIRNWPKTVIKQESGRECPPTSPHKFEIAWTRDNVKSRRDGKHIYPFKRTCENPRLSTSIEAMHFSALRPGPSLFFVALTVE